MIKDIYFISGASGVGKTSVMTELKKVLPSEYEVHDFDERGVPTGADHAWRLQETAHWIEFSKQKSLEGIHVVVCGFFNPDELKEMIPADFPFGIQTILLDADADIIEQRLRNRNKDSEVAENFERTVGSAENFIKNNTEFVPIIREICRNNGCKIIDTTNIEPKVVTEQLQEIILRHKYPAR